MGKAGKAGVAALVVAAASLSAVAATAAVPAGTPDPSAVVLKAADFPGATNGSHRSVGASGTIVAAYQNTVNFKSPYGASKYSGVISTALVETDTAKATSAYASLARLLSSAATRNALIKQFEGGGKKVKTTVVKPRSLGVPDSSMEIGFVATVPKKGSVKFSIELLRVDRVIVENVAVGTGKTVALADAKALTELTAGHVKSVLGPVATTLPAITGTAQVGQTLTATQGTWSNTPTAFAYQWQDCDATGTTCNAIAGVTGSTYVLQPTDANQTVRVTVGATNAYGTASASSAITAAVAGA